MHRVHAGYTTLFPILAKAPVLLRSIELVRSLACAIQCSENPECNFPNSQTGQRLLSYTEDAGLSC